MRIPLSWLQDYINLDGLSPQHIAHELTQLGLEVEAVESIAPVSGPLVVGLIEEAKPHPNADKLRVCQVDIGEPTQLSIVCGAPNARAGIKVAVARIGAVLPGNFKIKESKIRGEASFGMLCSESELGLSESHDGIIELPAAYALGASVPELLLMNDTIIEISVTPNRADCLGMLGVARDLSVRLNRKLKMPVLKTKSQASGFRTQDLLKLNIADAKLSQRFYALAVKNVQAQPSPLWLQRRLQHAGLRPINIIVDATNYVMLETGQPIHAYDQRDIRGGQLQVRAARAGETLSTLDGQRRELGSEDIVIADAESAIGLAGVMGGENSEVKADTQSIVIEVAHFQPQAIRKTAKRFALHTEASHRFERGIDGQLIPWVAQRTAQLIAQGLQEQDKVSIVATIADEGIDCFPQAFETKVIALRFSRLKKITALPDLKAEQVQSILTGLGFTCRTFQDEVWNWEIPSFRKDCEREIDLIEEVARMVGFDKIPLKLPKMAITHLEEHPLIDFLDQQKMALANLGLNEVITFPFMRSEDLQALQLKAEHPYQATVALANPLVENEGRLRTTLIPGLIQCVLENQKQGKKGVKLFECARVFFEPKTLPQSIGGSLASIKQQGQHIPEKARTDDRPLERSRIASIFSQPWHEKRWDAGEAKLDFFPVKDMLVRWLSLFGISNLSFEPIAGEDYPFLHPGLSALVKSEEGIPLGILGSLHPRTAKAYDLDYQHPPLVWELDVEAIYGATLRKPKYQSGSARFPAASRDLALVVARSLPYATIAASLAQFPKKKHLKSFQLFDVYQGSHLADDKKSVAFSLSFQADDRNLTDADVDKEIEALLKHLKSSVDADLR